MSGHLKELKKPVIVDRSLTPGAGGSDERTYLFDWAHRCRFGHPLVLWLEV